MPTAKSGEQIDLRIRELLAMPRVKMHYVNQCAAFFCCQLQKRVV